MNCAQIADFLLRFCAATACDVTEKNEAGLTVHLSPEIDRLLTNRPYYWMFVERMGMPPEPMRMRWLIDTEKGTTREPVNSMENAAAMGIPGFARLPELTCHFGSTGLQQIFQLAQEKGKFVRLFEMPSEIGPDGRRRSIRHAYRTWVCFDIKLEYICDLKREELLSLGVNLQTGMLLDRFYERMRKRSLQPQLPANTYLLSEPLTAEHAWESALTAVRKHLAGLDSLWIEQAWERHDEEQTVNERYLSLRSTTSEDDEGQRLYEQRRHEIARQYQPKVRISLLNGGLFHLDPSNLSDF